jgi:hypothetical protein
MAPLDFSDKINLYGMIGTWLGTLFTLIGLVAVIAQLRTLLRDISNSRDEIVKAAAGDWAICLPKLGRSNTGIIEGKAPSLRAWIHHYYIAGKSITVCPYERKSMSGQSSWSQLFCRLEILPEDLISPGHRDRNYCSLVDAPHVPTAADVLVDGSKISYGLPGEDFAALLILSGVSPSSFDPEKTTKVFGHLGAMYLATHSDPLSQIAQLDGTSWNTFSTFPGLKWEGRFADRLNVRHCLDLAVGILRFNCDGKPATILFSTSEPPWSRPVSPQQVLNIRRNLTALTGGTMEQNPIYDITSMAFPDFRQIFGAGQAAWQGVPFDFDAGLTENQMNDVFKITFGLSALKPWGLLAVIPQSIVDTFCPILKELLVKKSEAPTSTIILIQKFRELPATVRYSVPHRTRDAMLAALHTLCDVETRNFFGLSARCSLYYDAMIYVFENHNLKLEDVEIGLAAYCATKFAVSRVNFVPYYNYQATTLQWEVHFRGFLRQCLKGSPMNEVEPWACEVLALYLHAWLQEATDPKEDFLNNFRRRVFLG